MTRDVAARGQPFRERRLCGRRRRAPRSTASIRYDERVVARLHEATPAIVERALAAAEAARRDWAAVPGAERGRILRRAAEIMRARNRELSEIETLDTGKPLQETLVADAASGADALEFFGNLAGQIAGERMQFGADWAYTMRVPLGRLRGHRRVELPDPDRLLEGRPRARLRERHGLQALRGDAARRAQVAEILTEAGLPPGVFQVVQGRGAVGQALVTDPRVRKVSLTGSVATGRRVYAAAAEGMRHVTMELGGKSPLIVFADADLDAAVSGAILGNFYSSGQVCSNGTRVFVRAGSARRVPRPAQRAAQGRRHGRPARRGGELRSDGLGPADGDRAGLRREGRGRRARSSSAGGRRANRPGWFVEPTVFADVTDGMTIAREEIFGPVMCVLDFEDEDEVVARANATDFGLAAGVFTARHGPRAPGGGRDGGRHRLDQRLQPHAGRSFPFGGSKLSGIGRENAVGGGRALHRAPVGLCGAGRRRCAVLREVPPARLRAGALAPGSGGARGCAARHRRDRASVRAWRRGVRPFCNEASEEQAALQIASPRVGRDRAASRTLARRLRRWPAAILDPARSLGERA